MSKEKDLAKNTAIISIGRICTQCISFFLLPLYTAVLTTNEYGMVDLLVSYSALLLPIVTFAIEQALFRYLIDVRFDNNQKEKIISTTLIFMFVQCVMCSIVLSVIQVFLHNEYIPYFILMVLASICSTTMLQLVRGLGDNISYVLGSFITAITQVLCNIIFLVVFRLGPNGMLLATFAGNIVASIFLFAKTKTFKYFKFKKFDIKTLKSMLHYSIPLIPNQLCWWTMNASDKTIVAIFWGTASNGLLAVAHKFPNIYMQFSNIFNISWTESAALHINDEDADAFFTKTINVVFKLFASACAGIIVSIPFVIHWLVADQYFDAYYQIPIFMLASLGNVVVSLYGVIYVAYKKTKEIALTAFMAAIINAGSHLILIQFIGLYAASVSSLLGYGIMAVYRYFHCRKYIIIKFQSKTLVLVAFMISLAFVSYYLQNNILNIVSFIVILAISILLNREMIIGFLKFGKGYLQKK